MSCLPVVQSFLVPSNNQNKYANYVARSTVVSAGGRKKSILQTIHDELGVDENNGSESKETHQYSNERRMFLSTVAASATALFAPDDANAAFSLPFLGQQRSSSFSVISNRENSTSATAIGQPAKEPAYDQKLATESCLLELLPVKNKEFKTLEKEILKISVLRENDDEPPSEALFDKVYQKTNETLQFFDDQRIKLAPVFNQDDSTALSIEKATRGEFLLENLRNEISSLAEAIKRMDIEGTLVGQKRSLRALSEVGELLVDSFPYDVPVDGKFSFLPRLLGRAKVTFTITRPQAKGRGTKDVLLGNVTILADGFAAPITAGNFVDLSARGFYTGLPVKVLKKRLGAKPILISSEDNTVAYDIVSTVDKLTGEDSIVQKAIDSVMNKKQGQTAEEDEESGSGSVLTTMPIMGSFNEGFYDPLTAKARKLPLEIVQFDRRFGGRAKLSYESGFSPSNISPTSSSVLSSVLSPTEDRGREIPPLLTFDIPGLVAMNHPDKNLNGGSSEFFVLTEKDMKPDRVSLLNGQYAPFGYVVQGLDIMQNLQAGDIISATNLSEWGKLNLKKIRSTSFANAIVQSEDDDK
jgi:cyclophilin family peptidyl-prolyl cis-trans isomerase